MKMIVPGNRPILALTLLPVFSLPAAAVAVMTMTRTASPLTRHARSQRLLPLPRLPLPGSRPKKPPISGLI